MAFGAAAQTRASLDTVLSLLINEGRVGDARDVLLQTDPSPAALLFFDARLLKAIGQYPEAIETLRRVLELDPDYLNARRELAHTLLLDGQFTAARFNFETLLQIDRNPGMRAGYLDFINQIDRTRPFGAALHIALLPSTNVNRGTTNTVFDTLLGDFRITGDSQAKSGVGRQLGASAFLRQPLSDRTRLRVDVNHFDTRYSNAEFDVANTFASIGLEHARARSSYRLSPYIRRADRTDASSNTGIGAAANLGFVLNREDTLALLLQHETQDFDDQSDRDGRFSSAFLSFTRQMTASTALTGGIGLEYSRTQNTHFGYRGRKLYGGLRKAWRGGVITDIGLEAGTRDFNADFPLTDAPRADRFQRAVFGVTVTRARFLSFVPYAQCSVIANRSSVGLYDYNTTECQLSITRAF